MTTDNEQLEHLKNRIAALESRLARSREHFGSRDDFLLRTFEDAPIGMALVGLDEKIKEANAALCTMLGYSHDELLQRTVPEITHPDDRNLEATPKGEMREGAKMVFVIEKRYLRADGSVLTGRLTVSALLDDDAKPTYYLGQLEDVTREREAEAALRKSEARFRALVENTNDIFCILDPDRTLRFASPSFTEQLGWPAVEIEDRDFAELIDDQHRSSFCREFVALLADASHVVRLNVKLKGRERGERCFDLAGENRISIGPLGGVVLTLRDITEQRALQDKAYQAQRLDSIGRLAGGVAHDFNNMLSVILGAVHFLSRNTGDEVRRARDIAAIDDAATRARNLVMQLVAIGGQQADFVGNTDVQAAIESCSPLIRRILGERIEFVCDLEPARAQIGVSATQFEQVIFNFATNAADAMPDGGRFSVVTRLTAISADHDRLPPGRYVELEVVDTGGGVDPSTANQIFDPFFSTKAPGKGTGLGLATVYGIVRQAGGDITVDRAPGGGARFRVFFPEIGDTGVSTADRTAPSSASRGVVLVVDDDSSVLSIMTRFIADDGYQVVGVAGPREALDFVDAGSAFDLVVTDVIMPAMSGLELVDQIIERRGPVPVVFVSGFANADPASLRARGTFVAKPFAHGALLAALREQLPSREE